MSFYFCLLRMSFFPSPHLNSCGVEKPFIIPFSDLLAGYRIEQFPKRFVLVVNPQISGLIRRSDLIGTEKEPIG